MEDLADAVEAADGRNGFSVSMTGEWTLSRDLSELSQSDLESGELKDRPAGGADHPGPGVRRLGRRAAAALGDRLDHRGAGTHGPGRPGFTLSVFVINMLTAMGLALGIDYCLFVVSRVREERARGADHRRPSRAPAPRRAAPCSSAAAPSCWPCSAFDRAEHDHAQPAVGAILVGVVTVAGALTLLPALLALLGDRINALRVPIVGRWASAAAPARAASGRAWPAP